MYLLTDKANLANTVALGNGLGQFQLAAETLGNAAVAAHGVVTQ